MQSFLSPRDQSRLMSLASRLAASKEISGAAAIDLIDAALSAMEHGPHRRDVSEFASGMLAVRSRANAIIGAQVFRDPAWDMMLELLAAARQDRQVCVSSLCYASGVPNSTALRHIEYLDQLGLVVRTPDPEDHRRAHITATPEAVERMAHVVERLQHAALASGKPHARGAQGVQYGFVQEGMESTP